MYILSMTKSATRLCSLAFLHLAFVLQVRGTFLKCLRSLRIAQRDHFIADDEHKPAGYDIMVFTLILKFHNPLYLRM